MRDGVRFAQTTDELKASYQLRYRIYVEEMGRLKDDSDISNRELRDEHDQSARTLIAVKNQKVIGTLRILWGGDTAFGEHKIKTYHMAPFLKALRSDEICVVERLMVDKDYRGSSTMLRLYKETLRFIIDRKIELLLLASEPDHVVHYQRLGAHIFARPRLYEGIGPVIPMAQAMGDYDHQERVHSPFAMITKPEDWQHFSKTDAINNIVELERHKLFHSGVKTPHLDTKPLIADTQIRSAYAGFRLRHRIGHA